MRTDITTTRPADESPHPTTVEPSHPIRKMSIETVALQCGLAQARKGEAVPAVPSIVPSVGHIHDNLVDTDLALGYVGGVSPAASERFVYSRHGGPNQAALEEALSVLEGSDGAVSFSSGMAALHAGLLALVPSGGTVVAAEQLYGVTRSLLEHLSSTMGLKVLYADFLAADAVRARVEEAVPCCLLCEVMTNPLVGIVPLQEVARIARRFGAKLLVDNTFATPLLLRPLEWGADLVVHSSTKTINGHGDVLGGIVAGSADVVRRVYEYRRVLGAMPSSFDAWLALRGLRTLAVRLQRACSNALQISEWLLKQARVARVCYPGLPHDPGHETARILLRPGYFGSVLAFELGDLDRAGAFAFVKSLRLIRPVTSLGDVYTLILHPASASHRALSPEQRAAQGITEGLLRLSVGIEDPDDLIADLGRAFECGPNIVE